MDGWTAGACHHAQGNRKRITCRAASGAVSTGRSRLISRRTSGSIRRTKANYTDVFSTVMRKFGDRDEARGGNHGGDDRRTGFAVSTTLMFPERFFDVGRIAEQHAVTFAAGVAAGGLKPIFAVYSSFLQRLRQILHDVCIQNPPVKRYDRPCSLCGTTTGETHH